jgi:acetolactate synthase I/II/III large subunit
VTAPRNGAALTVSVLERLGVDCVFGLPGTQNLALFEALRRSRMRTIVATHELAASFMANGYFRASGRTGVLLTIPGPGFTYALTGLAEAFLDSAAVLHVVGRPADQPGRRFQLQALDQAAMVRPVCKRLFSVDAASDLEAAIEEAYALAGSGEPGPVVVQVAPVAFSGTAAGSPGRVGTSRPAQPIEQQADEVARLLARSRRCLIYAGQGATAASEEVRALAERLGAPVATTTSGRGVLPEDHPLCLRVDASGASGALNDLIDRADLVLALGCKFSHNGAQGFRLRFPPDRLVHVDASPEVLAANYALRLGVCADVPALVRALLAKPVLAAPVASEWKPTDFAALRATKRTLEPSFPALKPPEPATFFRALRRVLPARSCLVLDSGLHQDLARRHFEVRAPRGLVAPADLQSMGYAIPAAIGAKLAQPDRPVVAVLGDGGLAMSGLEMITAVRERLPLTVIVFNDGRLGLIHRQQVEEHGSPHGTVLRNPDFQRLAEAVGADYMRLDGEAEDQLARAIASQRVTLVEVAVQDSGALNRRRLSALARATVRRWVGPRLRAWVQRRR